MNLFPAHKICLLLVCLRRSPLFVVSRNWDLFRRKHFTLGVAAQFVYVAAQTGIFSFCVNYVLENSAGVTRLQASQWLGGIGFVLFMLGPAVWQRRHQPTSSLIACSRLLLPNAALLAVTMGGGKAGLYAMFASFFFMSVGFPTIFALGIRGLGEHTKLASSLIVMSIVGGAIAPPFMGRIADNHSMRIGFAVPLVCFLFVALYGLSWAKLSKQDILTSANLLTRDF